jgi:outer membrane protein TolC
MMCIQDFTEAPVPMRLARTSATFTVVFLATVSGCAEFEPRPLEPMQAAAALQSHSLEDPSLRAFVAANLGDTTETFSAWDLEGLTLAAYYFQPSLEVARAERAVAEAGLITADERPGVSVGVTPGTNTTTTTPTPRIVTLTADLSLETANKRGYRAAQAAQLAEAARLNIESVAWQVQSLLARQLAIHEDNLRILEGQYQAGAISAFELTRARVEADNTRLALRDAERREAEAQAELAAAIGVTVRAVDNAQFSFDRFAAVPGEPAAQSVREQALLRRADILRALAEYAASQSALQLEIARQYPDLHLGPGFEYDQGDNKWSLGLSVSLPPNRNRGAIAEAEARRAESAARFDALQAAVLGQVEFAAAAFTAARTKLADADAMLTDAVRQAQIAEGVLQAGAMSRAEYSALQLQQAATERSRLDALLEAQQAAGQLEDAVQAPIGLPSSVWETSPRAVYAAGNRGAQ